MKKLIVASSLMVLTTISFAKEYTTTKTSCIQQSEHAGKTLDQQKEVLINQAKQLALTDLYGEMIFSSTEVANGKLVSDDIKSKAIGAVRVKGNPSFYNGKNLGSICSDVVAYVTDEDIERFSPKEVTLNKYCFNDPSVPMNRVKTEAKYGAYKEIISQYKPSLKLSGKEAEKLIHGFKISNDNFDFDTASYCFNAVATVLPYELEMGGSSNKQKKEVDPNQSNTPIEYEATVEGITWVRLSRDVNNYFKSYKACEKLVYLGSSDWTLPTMKLVEETQSYLGSYEYLDELAKLRKLNGEYKWGSGRGQFFTLNSDPIEKMRPTELVHTAGFKNKGKHEISQGVSANKKYYTVCVQSKANKKYK